MIELHTTLIAMARELGPAVLLHGAVVAAAACVQIVIARRVRQPSGPADIAIVLLNATPFMPLVIVALDSWRAGQKFYLSSHMPFLILALVGYAVLANLPMSRAATYRRVLHRG